MNSKHLLRTKVEPGQSAETKLVLCSGELQRTVARIWKAVLVHVNASGSCESLDTDSCFQRERVERSCLTEAENTTPLTSLELIREVEVPHETRAGLLNVEWH